MEIIKIRNKVTHPPYYHPKGKYLVPILIKEGGIAINSHKGFFSEVAAKEWIDSHKDLVY
jgi:hypothetical protein